MAAALAGTGDLDATIAAHGNMAIDIVVTGTSLTTSNVGPAVWAAIAALNNDAGTMGEKLNLAGSGGVDYDALAAAVWAYLSRTLTGTVDANVVEVRGQDLEGTGTEGDPWGPA